MHKSPLVVPCGPSKVALDAAAGIPLLVRRPLLGGSGGPLSELEAEEDDAADQAQAQRDADAQPNREGVRAAAVVVAGGGLRGWRC